MGRVAEYRVGELETAVGTYYETMGAVQGTPCHMYIGKDFIAWAQIDEVDSTIDEVVYDEKSHRKLSPMNLQEALADMFSQNDAVVVHSFEYGKRELNKFVGRPLRHIAHFDSKYSVLIRTIGRAASELQKEKDGETHFDVDDQVQLAMGKHEGNTTPVQELYLRWKPKKIVAALDEYVHGQTDAKRALARTAYWHLQRIYDIETAGNTEMDSKSILLLGPTGAGKTLMSERLGKILGLPFVVRDATALTQAGILGEDVEDYMQEMWSVAGGNLKRLQYGIFLLDEIDKLVSSGGATEANGKGAQQRLLRFTEGSKIYMHTGAQKTFAGPDHLDSSHNMKIFSGSFMGKGAQGIGDIIKKRIKPSGLGFGVDHSEPEDLLEHVLDEDLRKFGILRELAARMTIKAKVNDLSIEDLRIILTEPKRCLIGQYSRAFEIDGHGLHVTDKALTLIAEEAKRRGSNARSLQPIVDSVFGPLQEDVAGEDPMDIEVTVTDVEKALGKKSL